MTNPKPNTLRSLLYTFLLLPLLGACGGGPRQQTTAEATLDRPQLVVGIVVDQMRYDFLYRYWNQYGDDGFKRLLREGFNFQNGHYNYAPTYTGPGHASVYTGTPPAVHGIIGNTWYNRQTGRPMYCTEDPTQQAVGTDAAALAGQMSPANLLTSTITDELRLSSNMRSKVIGIALKDRGSILPAGHTANGAYWYEGKSGHFISSTFYMPQVPAWVQQFNDRKLPDQYLSQPWTTLLPIEQYTQSTPDDVPWEKPFANETRPVFPHNLPAIRGNTFDLLANTPSGNTFTTEFAMEAIRAEQLGKRNATDFLALSYSSPDIIGHQFGPYSVEVQDVYLRLDRDIANLLRFLDSHVGQRNVLLFLTADHGAARSPAHLNQVRLPGGTLAGTSLTDSLKLFLTKRYGAGNWIERYMNQQVYLNQALVASRKVNLQEIRQATANFLLGQPAVSRTVTADALLGTYWGSGLVQMVEQGFYPKRSGDVAVILDPEWFEGYGARPHTGTTHGSPYAYDTHVPILWYGWQVKPGESAHRVSITDIAPTLATWLRIQAPSGTTGLPLQEFMK